jgi:hypothetical protein
LHEIATAWSNNGAADLKPLHGTDRRCTQIRVLDLLGNAGAEGTVAGWGEGSRSGESLPANTCMLANLKIGRRYRGGKPRTYYPFGVRQDMNTPQTWSTTATAAIQSALETFNGVWLGLTYGNITLHEHCSVHYYEKGTWATDPVTGRPRYIPKRVEPPHVDPILSIAVSNRIATQRRRLAAGA